MLFTPLHLLFNDMEHGNSIAETAKRGVKYKVRKLHGTECGETNFWTLTFPNVTEINRTSISSGLDARVYSRASTSSLPCESVSWRPGSNEH